MFLPISTLPPLVVICFSLALFEVFVSLGRVILSPVPRIVGYIGFPGCFSV